MTELKESKTADFWGQPAITNPRVLADGFAATGRFAPISAGRGASSLLRQHSLWEVLWLRPSAKPTKDPGGEVKPRGGRGGREPKRVAEVDYYPPSLPPPPYCFYR